MKRNVFLIIAALLATFFGINMLLMPGQMLQNMANVNTIEMQHVLQWGGAMLISIGLINFLSRNDAGSKALRAVMIGNIFMHIVAFIVDGYDYSIDFIKLSGLVMGGVVHGLLIFGFIYYLPKSASATTA
jgi:hypothetical protein